MKRVFLTTCIAAVLLLSAPAFAAAGDEVPLRILTQSIEGAAPIILVNGAELVTEPKPELRNGIAFVSVGSPLADAFWADIVFNDKTPGAFTVRIKTKDAEIVFSENRTRYTIDGLPHELPQAPFLEAGFLMVPARELFEALRFTVVWDVQANTMTVTRKMVPVTLPNDVVQSVFAKSQKAAPSAAKPKRGPLEFTYDNTIGGESVSISGDKSQSNLIARNIANNEFNIRTQQMFANGYQVLSTIRTLITTDKDQNKGQLSKFSLFAQKGDVNMSLYDMFPKFTYYALKNYQVRGGQYQRTNNQFMVTALAGKTPKKLGDSDYARYIQGFRINRSLKKDHDFGISLVRTKDTGSTRSADRISNDVLTLNTLGRLDPKTKLLMECARSWTKIFGVGIKGNACSLQMQHSDAQNVWTMLYERNGSNFDSETAILTQGRREFSGLLNRRMNKHTLLGAGYKSVLLRGEETRSVPLLVSATPIKGRPHLKFTMQRNYEKARDVNGPRITETKTIAVTDRFGSVKLDGNFDRRKLKERGGLVSFRTQRRVRADFTFSQATNASLQYKVERRTSGANPLTRTSQLMINHELKSWNDLMIGIGRYYNGTTSNRNSFSIGYKKVDVENSTEFNLAFEYYDYKQHDDKVVRADYSFFR